MISYRLIIDRLTRDFLKCKTLSEEAEILYHLDALKDHLVNIRYIKSIQNQKGVILLSMDEFAEHLNNIENNLLDFGYFIAKHNERISKYDTSNLPECMTIQDFYLPYSMDEYFERYASQN